jgi:hypothetical protein
MLLVYLKTEGFQTFLHGDPGASPRGIGGFTTYENNKIANNPYLQPNIILVQAIALIILYGILYLIFYSVTPGPYGATPVLIGLLGFSVLFIISFYFFLKKWIKRKKVDLKNYESWERGNTILWSNILFIPLISATIFYSFLDDYEGLGILIASLYAGSICLLYFLITFMLSLDIERKNLSLFKRLWFSILFFIPHIILAVLSIPFFDTVLLY